MFGAALAILSVAAAQPPLVVGVPVATLWVSPAKAVTIGPPRSWARLTTAQRLNLVGRIETQALYGDGVRVLARRGKWAKVVVPSQRTPRDPRGYPGWVRASSLATMGPLRAQGELVVTARKTTITTKSRTIEVSYGTRLLFGESRGARTTVALPGGGTGTIPTWAVSTKPLPGTAAAIIADARLFERVRYLWGGTSAYGWDCSGLLHRVFATHGVRIPRDADAQALTGRPVARTSLRPGDLVFFGVNTVHHVVLYIGNGRILESPNSAAAVRVVKLKFADYAGARRYLP